MENSEGVRVDSTTDTPQDIAEALGLDAPPEQDAPEDVVEPTQEAQQPDAGAVPESPPDHDDNMQAEDDDPFDESGLYTGQDKNGRRWNRMLHERRQYIQENARLRGELEGLKAAQSQPEPQPQPEPAQPQGPPNRYDFESEDDYITALVDYRTDQKIQSQLAQRDQRQQEQEQQRQVEQTQQQWREREADTVERYPDYLETVTSVREPVSNETFGVLLELERGPEMLYHLSKVPGLLTKLSNMTYGQVAFELGKVDQRMAAREAQSNGQPRRTTPQRRSQPVTPPTPVGESADTGGSLTYEQIGELPQQEFNRLRREGRI